MAEIKSAQADSFVARPDLKFRTFLFYGPDSGLVSERAEFLCGKLGIDVTDPFSVVRLDADAVAADNGRLSDEANTIGMFGGSRLLRISGTTRRNLADAVKPVLDRPPSDCWIVIEAGDLKREAALRRLVERSASGAAIGCYPDNEAGLDRLIETQLSAAGLQIDREAKLLLRSHIGSDRRASRNELEKLALYCHGRQRVSVQDIVDIIGDTSLIAADDVIDAVATGDLRGLESLLARLSASGMAADMLILATLRHFQLLQLARHRLDAEGKPAAAVVAGLRPPLFYKRRDAFLSALGMWTGDAISKALSRLDRAALEARANPQLGRSLAGTALIALALEASRGRRRR